MAIFVDTSSDKSSPWTPAIFPRYQDKVKIKFIQILVQIDLGMTFAQLNQVKTLTYVNVPKYAWNLEISILWPAKLS